MYSIPDKNEIAQKRTAAVVRRFHESTRGWFEVFIVVLRFQRAYALRTPAKPIEKMFSVRFRGLLDRATTPTTTQPTQV